MITRELIQQLFTNAGLGFAVSDARNWEHTDDREYTANLFGAIDKRLAPTSESSLWGLCLEAVHDDRQPLTDLIPWWLNVYRAAVDAHDAEDQDRYDQILTDVYEGNGDTYQ